MRLFAITAILLAALAFSGCVAENNGTENGGFSMVDKNATIVYYSEFDEQSKELAQTVNVRQLITINSDGSWVKEKRFEKYGPTVETFYGRLEKKAADAFFAAVKKTASSYRPGAKPSGIQAEARQKNAIIALYGFSKENIYLSAAEKNIGGEEANQLEVSTNPAFVELAKAVNQAKIGEFPISVDEENQEKRIEYSEVHGFEGGGATLTLYPNGLLVNHLRISPGAGIWIEDYYYQVDGKTANELFKAAEKASKDSGLADSSGVGLERYVKSYSLIGFPGAKNGIASLSEKDPGFAEFDKSFQSMLSKATANKFGEVNYHRSPFLINRLSFNVKSTDPSVKEYVGLLHVSGLAVLIPVPNESYASINDLEYFEFSGIDSFKDKIKELYPNAQVAGLSEAQVQKIFTQLQAIADNNGIVESFNNVDHGLETVTAYRFESSGHYSNSFFSQESVKLDSKKAEAVLKQVPAFSSLFEIQPSIKQLKESIGEKFKIKAVLQDFYKHDLSLYWKPMPSVESLPFKQENTIVVWVQDNAGDAFGVVEVKPSEMQNQNFFLEQFFQTLPVEITGEVVKLTAAERSIGSSTTPAHEESYFKISKIEVVLEPYPKGTVPEAPLYVDMGGVKKVSQLEELIASKPKGTQTSADYVMFNEVDVLWGAPDWKVASPNYIVVYDLPDGSQAWLDFTVGNDKQPSSMSHALVFKKGQPAKFLYDYFFQTVAKFNETAYSEHGFSVFD
ncbi:MAG: hypothetical protein Q7R70_01915 [Candidatus Diapherotrites archaeon]|nr:hypothetical protein [Candidatus Diapherotrites archaeon]